MDMLRAFWRQALEALARGDVDRTFEGRLWIAVGLVAGSLLVGFILGFAVRAYISRRRRAAFRRRIG